MSDNKLVISDEAVEAAAKAYWESDAGVSWEEHTTDDYRDRMREAMRTALEAVTPSIAAEAWEDGALSVITNTSTRLTNPYRSQA
jgi:hypothetical protein